MLLYWTDVFILATFTQLFYHLSVQIVLLILVAILLKSNMFKKGEKKSTQCELNCLHLLLNKCTV